jgi:hypothetical protein
MNRTTVAHALLWKPTEVGLNDSGGRPQSELITEGEQWQPPRGSCIELEREGDKVALRWNPFTGHDIGWRRCWAILMVSLNWWAFFALALLIGGILVAIAQDGALLDGEPLIWVFFVGMAGVFAAIIGRLLLGLVHLPLLVMRPQSESITFTTTALVHDPGRLFDGSNDLCFGRRCTIDRTTITAVHLLRAQRLVIEHAGKRTEIGACLGEPGGALTPYSYACKGAHRATDDRHHL